MLFRSLPPSAHSDLYSTITAARVQPGGVVGVLGPAASNMIMLKSIATAARKKDYPDGTGWAGEWASGAVYET